VAVAEIGELYAARSCAFLVRIFLLGVKWKVVMAFVRDDMGKMVPVKNC